MNPQVIASFDSENLPRLAVERFGGDPQSLKSLGVSQNFVYRFEDTATRQGRILRISTSSHRSAIDLGTELEFLTYLKAQGCGVAAPIATPTGKLVESLPCEGGDYHAVVFEEILGDRMRFNTDDKTARKQLFGMGQWLGKLHAKSVDFQPTQAMRFHWFEDDLWSEPEQYLPESQPELRQELSNLIRYINGRPADKQNYGLIHGDLGLTNFRMHEGRIIAFDFDDCSYHWFTFDIAVAMLPFRTIQPKFRRPYFLTFLDGYQKEKSLCGDTCKEISWFSRLSAMNRYIHAQRTLDPASPDPRQVTEINARRQEVLAPIDWCE